MVQGGLEIEGKLDAASMMECNIWPLVMWFMW